MPRLHLLRALLVLAGLGSVARAYGPGVHLREIDRYVALHPEWADPELTPYLQLGAVFPDIRGTGIPLPINSHDKDLGDAIAAVADESGLDWQRAFALGYRLHTASDSAAQVHYVPWLTAATDLQVVNLFGAEDVAHVGDNELLIEGFGDLRSGDLAAFVEVVWHFVHEHPSELEAVIDLFLAGLVRRGVEVDEPAIRQGLAAFWARLRDNLPRDSEAQFLSLVEDAAGWDLQAVLGLLQVGPLAELLGGLPAAPGDVSVDPDELARLEAHPVGREPDTFFAAYTEHFADLGGRILDDPAYRPWPWYHRKTIIAAVVTGLARSVPGLSHRPEVLVYDAGFGERAGAEATAFAELFLAFGDPVPVRLEVVADPPGILTRPGPEDIVATTTAMVRAGPERARLEVAFTPREGAVEAHHLRLVAGDDATPFLTSDWDFLAAFADAPLFRAPYRDGYAGFPPAYPRPTPAVDVGFGWVRGHAIAGPIGIPAEIEVDGHLATEAGPGGAFVVEPLAPGAHTFSARGRGWGTHPQRLEIEAGRLTVVELSLEAVPIVADGPAWSSYPTALIVSWSGEGLDPETTLEVAVGDARDPEAYAPWRAVATATSEVTVALAAAADDGTRLYGWVRAAGGPGARSAPTSVDATPPTVEIGPVSCSPHPSVRIDAEDPHAPVVAVEARLDQGPWRSAAPGETLSWDLAGGPFVLSARSNNAAELVSTVLSLEICAPEVAAGPDPVADDGGGCGAAGAGAPLVLILFGLGGAGLTRPRRPRTVALAHEWSRHTDSC